MSLYEKIINGEEKIALVGLGYVGMPIAVAFAKKAKVIGYDLNEKKIELYKSGIDPTNEVGNEGVKLTTVEFTSDEKKISEAKFIIVAVPTVIIETTNHNVGFLASLFESVSAFSTTGLTMGITPTLNIASKLALTFAMFAGRVGPVSLALALAMRKGRHSSSVLPEGKIIVG